jgi:cyclic dehypoxanthinyl futalosine synthase
MISTHQSVDKILASVLDGNRLGQEDALVLLESNALAKIGKAANEICLQKHPESYRTYNIDRNINYTNICERRKATRDTSYREPNC